ncbi:MAG: DUF1294 domain-containing protein [Deltaproteobacteria bacterium HGW-Deltaproteobacteria-18]|jgi:uncharacterized membrane protein YsdA (DUF1294 family)/cold shock CspA family protein|nr:MAG: DUF1294 domain-containing protein [Deltaproteobacteria bacterium HGW-Deltaproteobacteria-18]
MRRTGRIVSWNEERGFGFVRPDDGGDDVFAHISAFRDRARRPYVDDTVNFLPGSDANGRRRAEQVVYSGALPVPGGCGFVSLGLAGAALFSVFGASVTGRLPSFASGWYVAVSLVAFLVYAKDKWAARGGRWRTQESTLHLLSLVGGWPGALAAQAMLRHKSRKQSFRVAFWWTVVMNCGVLGWMLTERGRQFLWSFMGEYADMGFVEVFKAIIGG